MELGQIKKLDFSFEEPINISSDMDVNDLTVLIGVNGSGKTLVLKMKWYISSVGFSTVKALTSGVEFPEKHLAQYLFDNTFVDPEDFTGYITCKFENGEIQVGINKGKIQNVISQLEDVTSASCPVFMSKNMRTFEDLDSYLRIRDTLSNQENILKHYKLYDSMFAEQMIARAEKEYEIDHNLKEALENYDMGKYDIQSLRIIDNKFHFINSEGESKKLSKLSAGEQSILVMFIGSR